MSTSSRVLALTASGVLVFALAFLVSSSYLKGQIVDLGFGGLQEPDQSFGELGFEPAENGSASGQNGGTDIAFGGLFTSPSSRSSSSSAFSEAAGYCCVDVGGGSLRCVPGFSCRDTLAQCSEKCGSSSSSSSSSLSSSRSSSSSSTFSEAAGYCCVNNGGTMGCVPGFTCRDTLAQCSAKCGSSSSSTSSSSCSVQPQLFSDLSVILDADKTVVSPGGSVTYTVKVRNSGPDQLPGATVFLLRNDMSVLQSTAFCFVQDSDPTYVRCTVPQVSAGQSTTFTVSMQLPPTFNCIESTGGRPAFAFVRSPAGGNQDLYPQNNTSNILNLLPVCN